ncbi:MAG: DUF6180 family protein [Proteobacteria bacterium]|nr:DUF6180 family protein [Pseudomonadota bacterium]
MQQATTRAMARRAAAVALAGLVALAGSLPVAADDFGLSYDVERVPATQLSVADCVAAIRRASDAEGFTTRSQQDQGRVALFVSGPGGDGKALVAYCIQAGTRTVWVVQMLDYAGPGNAASERVTRQVAAELRRAAGMPGKR